MRNILFILAALIGFGAFAQTNIPTRQMLADTNGVVKWPTNITSITIGGRTFTNMTGFGLSLSNGQLSVDTSQLPVGSGGSGGTVTSVGLSLPAIFTVSGSPVTLNGTLSGSLVDQAANRIFAGPTTGADAAPTFRALVDADMAFADSESLWTATTLGAALEELNNSINAGVPNGTGAKVDWSQLLSVPAGFADGTDDGAGGGSGTMTGIAFATVAGLPFAWSPTSTTTSNTFTLSASNQTANLFFAGPSSGGAAAPTFRAIVDDDVPNTITVDLATTATTANAGDSATAFFSSGTVEDARIDSALARDSEVSSTYAPLASPALTGTPTVNGTNLMAYAAEHLTEAEASALYQRTNANLTTLATLNGSALTNLNGTEIRSGTVVDARIDLALARLASPTFTGSPAAPTASISESNTLLATTAFAHQIAELRQLASSILTQLSALTNGSAGQVPTWTGANTLALSNLPSGGGSADFQVFTSGTNTWTKPSGKTAVYVLCIGAGGGGGSGRRGASTTIRGGGGGGASGAASEFWFAASDLGGTETVTVGAGGGGGASITSNDINGIAGTNATASTFGNWLYAGGGWGGGGGTAAGATGGNGSGGSADGRYVGSAGIGASGTGAAGSTGNNTINNITGAGGASGGGITAGDAESSGGAGGSGPRMWRGSGAIAGGTAGTAGNPGGIGGSGGTGMNLGGGGGGGGGSKRTADAGAGGAGGLYGAGGGGGGASENGFNSGAGGAGANGIVVVISY